MSKVAFSKLGATKETGVTEIVHNEQKIEVKKYLPISEKLDLIASVMNSAYDGTNNFMNPLQVSTYLNLAIVEKYTNINFTEKQKEDPAKLIDLLTSSDLLTEIQMAIPKSELNIVVNGTWDTIEAFFKYKNSALGILEAIGTDYSNLDLDATEIQKKIGDPKNMELLKDVLSKMG